jgi:hypothetical protein
MVDDRWIDSLIVWHRHGGGVSVDALDMKQPTTLIRHTVTSLILQPRTHLIQKMDTLRDEFFAEH